MFFAVYSQEKFEMAKNYIAHYMENLHVTKIQKVTPNEANVASRLLEFIPQL